MVIAKARACHPMCYTIDIKFRYYVDKIMLQKGKSRILVTN